MNRSSSRPRGSIFARRGLSHVAYVAALGLGVAAGTVALSSPAMAGAAKASYSPDFVKQAAPLQEQLGKAKGTTPDATVTDTLKKQLAAAIGAIKNGDDKLLAGQFSLQVGGLVNDSTLQRQGVQMMLDSGKAAPDLAPKLHFFAGQFAFQAKDYPATITEMKAASAGGYTDPNGDVMMAESYFNTSDNANGLLALQSAISKSQAAKSEVPEGWFIRGLQIAYSTKNLAAATSFGSGLVVSSPANKKSWTSAIEIIRAVGAFNAAEQLDLLRLMQRTHSWGEERDYIDFIESADARRNPGEVRQVIDEGVASGMLKASNTYVAEASRIATTRIAADKASLPSFEKDARAPSAPVATVTGAADAFLSYGQAAKAIELYQIAAGKSGADLPLINTRLGIAQIDSGDYAGAQASLAKVSGNRGPIAAMWTTYAQTKAAGK